MDDLLFPSRSKAVARSPPAAFAEFVGRACLLCALLAVSSGAPLWQHPLWLLQLGGLHADLSLTQVDPAQFRPQACSAIRLRRCNLRMSRRGELRHGASTVDPLTAQTGGAALSTIVGRALVRSSLPVWFSACASHCCRPPS